MCGRYVSTATRADLVDYFDIDHVRTDELGPRYNVAPTDAVYVVRERDDGRALTAHRWGLVPSWADDPGMGSRLINARAETLADKPAFRRALERRRCLVPADGFYEWQRRPDRKGKQPFYLHHPDGSPMAFAGLWEVWHDAEDVPLLTCTIITTDASDDVADLHDRMPAIVAASDWERWLARDVTDPAEVTDLLAPSRTRIVRFPVSTLVNHVGNDGPQLLEPEDPLTLF